MPQLPARKKRGEEFPDRDFLIAATDFDLEAIKKEYNILITHEEVGDCHRSSVKRSKTGSERLCAAQSW
jgi:hypothetical protein